MVKGLAIVIGVGPGTGAAVAVRFAKEYNVALLARSQQTLDPVLQQVQAEGAKGLAIPTDVTSEESVKAAFTKIKKTFPDNPVQVAVYNVSAPFVRTSFLDMTLAEYEKSLKGSPIGGFIFAQAALPLLLEARGKLPLSPTLIFTGATASIRGSAKMSGFASAKFALRALSQSLAREYGPEGVHVSHTVIDGVIDTPRTTGYLVGAPPGSKMELSAIAETYYALHAQHHSCWTWEVDCRPSVEKW